MDINKDNDLGQILSQKKEDTVESINIVDTDDMVISEDGSFDLSQELIKICSNNFEDDGGIIVNTSSVGPFNTSEFDFSDDFIGHKNIVNDSLCVDNNIENLNLNTEEKPGVIGNQIEDTNLGTLDTGVDIKESVAKKQRLLDKKTVDEISFKFDLNEKDTDNLKKLNMADAINVDFFLKLRDIFKKVQIKSKIMDEFNIRKSYTGFHDWFDGERIDLPNVGMNSIAQNLGYSLMIVPIRNNKLDSKHKVAIDNLQMDFLDEIEERIQVIVKEDASKIKPKKLPKVINNAAAAKAMATLDNSDLALGFVNEENKMVTDDIISENEKFIDNNEEIVERTVVLNDSISFDEYNENGLNTNSSEVAYNFDPGSMDQIETSDSEEEYNITPIKTDSLNIGISNMVGGVDMMDFEYNDSLEETVIEKKPVISHSPFDKNNK